MRLVSASTSSFFFELARFVFFAISLSNICCAFCLSFAAHSILSTENTNQLAFHKPKTIDGLRKVIGVRQIFYSLIFFSFETSNLCFKRIIVSIDTTASCLF